MKLFSGICLFSVSLITLPRTGNALRFEAGGRHSMQESAVAAPLGKLTVSPKVMEGLCLTKVSPTYPQAGSTPATASTVIVRAVIWKSGAVTPMRVISGDPLLETEAMNTLRLWRYKPFVRDAEPLDITTDIRIEFDPTTPGGTVTHPHR